MRRSKLQELLHARQHKLETTLAKLKADLRAEAAEIDELAKQQGSDKQQEGSEASSPSEAEKLEQRTDGLGPSV